MVRLVAEKRYGRYRALSRRPATAIFRSVLLRLLNRGIAVALCVTVFFMGITPLGRRGAVARAQSEAPAGADPAAAPPFETASAYRLRDAVPVSAFVAAPPDTVEEDDFFLPEETDRKNLIRDITVFVIASVFVAFFIIKVFIEKDDDPPPDDDNGKNIPPPQ